MTESLDEILKRATLARGFTWPIPKPEQIPPPSQKPCAQCGIREAFGDICSPCSLGNMRVESAIAQLPPAYRWSHPDAPDLPNRAPRWGAIRATILDAVQNRRSAVLIGPAGSGKTSVAAAMIRHAWAIHQAEHPRFFHAHRLAIARGQHGLGEGEAPMVHWAMTSPMVVIDDLGNERKTELSAVMDVIFDRHAESLCTWYTTPFGHDEISKRYGDGIARRVFEGALVVDLGAKT